MVNHTTARVVMREPVDMKALADGRSASGGGVDMTSSRPEVRLALLWFGGGGGGAGGVVGVVGAI